jgi:hypothetical protein
MKLSLAIVALALAFLQPAMHKTQRQFQKESIPIRFLLGLPMFPHLPINPKDLMIGLFLRGWSSTPSISRFNVH